MKLILTLAFIVAISLKAFSQDNRETETKNKNAVPTYSYAYIAVEGKLFSKKLKVEVDFGDTPEQMKAGKEYSEILTNKKSYSAILNYMAESQFELVNSLDLNSTYQGNGGSSGIAFILRKKN
jgi:hypothetical protein